LWGVGHARQVTGSEGGPEQSAEQLGQGAAGPDRDQADRSQQHRRTGQLGDDRDRRDRANRVENRRATVRGSPKRSIA
jgi:hypothetical protein